MKQKIDEETLIATRHLINIEEMGVLEDCSSEIRVEELWGGDRVSDGIPLVQKSPLKDSGTRDVFSTGAVRDADDTKGRMDLVPMDIIGDIAEHDAKHTDFSHLYASICKLIDQLNWSKDLTPAYQAFSIFGKAVFGNLIEAVLELSIHYKEGALKYEEHNWRKGIPLFRYVDSAERHLGKWYRGDKDEPHARAVLWNIVCYIWTVENFSVHNDEICNLPWCKDKREEDRLSGRGPF